MINLSIGILTFNSPLTLSNTLLSYKKGGLFDTTDDIIVWIQQSPLCKSEEEICKQHNLKYHISETNNWIAAGFKGLVELSKYDNVLLLENDFKLVETPENTFKILYSGVKHLNDRITDMVKLRSRYNPGHPNWGAGIKGKELQPQYGCITHLSECIYWTETPEIDYPTLIKKISDNPIWYKSKSSVCNFTNNPCMFRKEFYKQYIYPFCIDKTDIETAATKWWCTQDFNCTFGNGLFKHERTDAINHCYR